jgi:cytochrome c peroxidase
MRFKVPLGLPDPTPLIPAANPPTMGKWTLGRQLFYDPTWLTADGKTACATCHKTKAFTDGVVHDGFRTPSLVNVVYNRTQFHDGRVVYLEEVVQRTLDDERLPEQTLSFRHVWGGVVTRLSNDAHWRGEFEKVFGTGPTQDALGKAMATYLRTLLAGDSLQDRADAKRRSRSAATLTAEDYQSAIDDAFLTSIGQTAEARTKISQRLQHGNELFQTWCIRCHSGPTYSDHGFHNLGVGDPVDLQAGVGLGRFAALPIGLKQPEALGAYATPTLRGLPRTGAYMHNGEMTSLEAVVKFHAEGGHDNWYLDKGYKANHLRYGNPPWDLTAEEQSDVVLFLRALEGMPVHPSVAGPPGKE